MTGFSSVKLYNGGDGTNESYVDAVPEPATIGLLGVGGLLALVRKNRSNR